VGQNRVYIYIYIYIYIYTSYIWSSPQGLYAINGVYIYASGQLYSYIK